MFNVIYWTIRQLKKDRDSDRVVETVSFLCNGFC